jgi:hypothetical protein
MGIQLARPPIRSRFATAGLRQCVPDIPQRLTAQFVCEPMVHEGNVLGMTQPERFDLTRCILLHLSDLRLVARLKLLDLRLHLSHPLILSLSRIQLLTEPMIRH